MRTKRFFQNVATSVGGQLLSIILQFVGRTVFIYTLGAQYLGISGLFSNIISVLNVTELGLGAAITYSLYEPLAHRDEKKVCSIMHLLRKAYFFVGLFVLVVGVIVIPFLPYLMKETTTLVNIPIVFMLYVMQSVSSYWFYAYKSLIFKADQKAYIANMITYLAGIIGTVVQILVLVIYKSFLGYTLVGISINIVGNIFVAHKADRCYPYLKETPGKLSLKDRQDILKNVLGTSIYKVNSIIVRSTDNIIISAFISTVAVGVYDNYHLITNTIMTFVKMFFASATAGIGNFVVTEEKKQSEFLFRVMSILAFCLYGICTVCLAILVNPFITIVWGSEWIFEETLVCIIVLDFLMDGFQTISIIYKDACGLFWKGKYRPVATAILNLIISLGLVNKLGVEGVILGTIISRLLTTWWYEPMLIYKNVFAISAKGYFRRYFIACALVGVDIAVLKFLVAPLGEPTMCNLLVMAVLSIIVAVITAFVALSKTEELKYMVKMIEKIVKKKWG